MMLPKRHAGTICAQQRIMSFSIFVFTPFEALKAPIALSLRLFVIVFALVCRLNFAIADAKSEHRENYLSKYAQSLEQRVGMKSERLNQIAEHTFIAKQSLLEQWGVIPAAASYRSIVNTISLPPHLIRSEGPFKLRIKSLDQLSEAGEHVNLYEVAMIFHELSHAEFEHLVLKPKNQNDLKLRDLFLNQIEPWIKVNFPELSRRQARIAAWELFGYYRHEALYTLLTQRDEILNANGLFAYGGGYKCIVTRRNRELIKQVGFPSNLKMLAPSHLGSIAPKISVPTVFVMGQDVEFEKARDSKFKDEWNQALWLHFVNMYQVPESGEALAQILWNDSSTREQVRNCWSQYVQ
jgi:hypothetical protein